MALNPYFYNNPSEQSLVEDITIEIIKATGQDCLYIPRDYLNIDKLFGEDPGSAFTKSYPIEMYLQSYRGFDGTDIVTQFGIEIKDKVNLIFARKRFTEEVTYKNISINRPREGDLIYFPLSKSLFEINFVEHENPLYPLGKLYSYFITAELFTYSYEKINTKVAVVDRIVENTRQDNYEYMFILSEGGGTFYTNNSVYIYDQEHAPALLVGGASASSWDSINKILTVSGVSGNFSPVGLTNYLVQNGNCAGTSYSNMQTYIIPMNNSLGTTAGINDDIDDEADIFDVDKNKPC